MAQDSECGGSRLNAAGIDQMFALMSQGVWHVDGAGKTTYVNARMAAMVGYSREEFARLSPLSFVPDEDRGRIAAKLARGLDGVRRDYECQLAHKDGSWISVTVEAMPLYRDDGKYGGILALVTDVTERNRTEKALHESAAMLKSITDTLVDPLFLKDTEGRWLFANPAALAALGRSVDQVLGKTSAEIHANDGSTMVLMETDRRVIDSGTTEVLEEVVHTPRGIRTFVSSKAPLRDADGRIVGLVGSARDITDQKQLDAAIAHEDRLVAMGLLAAGIAHEINNPLTYVLLNLERLVHDLPMLVGVTTRCRAALRNHLGEAALEALAGDHSEVVDSATLDELVALARSALEGVRRIHEVSRTLGMFARAERTETESVDVNLAMQDALTMTHNEVKFRATLVQDFGDVPSVLASHGKLSQVFTSLLINAAHAIDEGDVDGNRITVRTWAADSHVFAEVADSGNGIPPETLERVFEPFFSTKPGGTGAGLGLAISKNIVTEFGGDIRVVSQFGRGARFVVRLPAQSVRRIPLPALAVSATVPEPVVRGRVLIVEDEEPIRSVLGSMLRRHHDVVAVASGRQAQALLEKDQAFDIILCDLMMPEMTGMDLHAWLLARIPTLARKVVFISGGAFTPRASAYLAHVPNRLIEKPFDYASLDKVVSEFVESQRSGHNAG